jgi:digeranylgeranylglycerophospholipid reductase
MWDVAIVGAGVAGLSCAIRAAEKGAKVVLLDRRKEIGFPIRSTGGIAYYWAKKLGIPADELDFAYKINKVFLVSPSCYKYGLSVSEAGSIDSTLPIMPSVGYVLDHGQFEKYLAAEAVNKGVTLIKNCRVDSLDKLRKHFPAKFYVGADGPYSTVRRDLGIPDNGEKDVAVGFEYWLPKELFNVKDEGIYVHYNIIAGDGYSWWFPYKDYVKVGLGVSLHYARKMGIKDLEDLLKDYLQLFLIDYPATGYVLNSGKLNQFKSLYEYVKNKIGGVIPVPPPLKRVVYGKVALIGDAGNIINSAVGGGIATSMFSGQMCGDAIAEGDLEIYQKDYRKRLYPFLMRWYKLKRLIYEKLSREDLDRFVSLLSVGPYVPKSANPLRALSGALWHVARRDIRLMFKIIGGLLW